MKGHFGDTQIYRGYPCGILLVLCAYLGNTLRVSFGSTSGLFWKYLRGYCWIILVSFWNHCKGGFESTLGFQGKYFRGHCGTFWALFRSITEDTGSICGILGE